MAEADRLAKARARIIVALDLPSRTAALRAVEKLHGRAGMMKVGSQLFTAAGPALVRELVRGGERVFLDLKFHDIPHIVAEACANAAEMGATLITVHTAGGAPMLRAARAALEKHGRGRARPRLLGVTVLTSLSARELRGVGLSGGVEVNVIRRARLALRHGCDGVVAAPSDVGALRRALGRNFLIVTPGIQARGGARAADQKRVATAAEAVGAGVDYVVVGRAILQARSPVRALEEMAEEISAVIG